MPMVWSFGKLMIIQSFKDTVVRYAGCLIFRITANQVHFLGGFAIFHTRSDVGGGMENCQTTLKVHLIGCGNG